jgi:hypothetical protein
MMTVEKRALRAHIQKNDHLLVSQFLDSTIFPCFFPKQIFLQAKLLFLRYPKEIFLTFPINNTICLGIAVAPFELTKAKKRQEE